jgi:phosphoribosylformylglycinamidine synthase
MLVLRGAPALSEFRLQKLAVRLREQIGEAIDVYAEYVHFAELSAELAGHQRDLLERLLRYGPNLPSHPPMGRLILIVPRPGTISPWSSKATDIARNCGIESIKRLERGTGYYMTGATGSLDAATMDRAAAILHDRMTQVALFDLTDAAQLFAQTEPRPVGRVALGTDAEAALAQANRDLGLALSADEIAYLAGSYAALERDPTDV